MDVAVTTATKFLSCDNKLFIGMTSQLLVETTDAMLEVRLAVEDKNIDAIAKIDEMFAAKLDALETPDQVQMKLRCKYLQKAIRWSDLMGSIRFGELKLHSLLASALWQSGERGESMSHSALAEEPLVINERLSTVEKSKEKDVLFCRAVLVLLSTENLRDANTLSTSYIEGDKRNFDKLAAEFLSKEVKSKNYAIFCTCLLGICEREKKAGALYTWLLGKFQAHLQQQPELLPYTTKIGQTYFNIQPPPSMLKQMQIRG